LLWADWDASAALSIDRVLPRHSSRRPIPQPCITPIPPTAKSLFFVPT